MLSVKRCSMLRCSSSLVSFLVVARVVLAAGGIAVGSAVAVVVAVVAAVFVTAAPRGTLEVAEALVGVEAFKPP